MDKEIVEKVSLSVSSISSLNAAQQKTIIEESLTLLRNELIFKASDLAALINSVHWKDVRLKLKIKLDLEVGFRDLPVSDDEEDNRRISFGNKDSTYILLVKIGGVYQPIGNAVAVSAREAITARHYRRNLGDRFILARIPLLNNAVLTADEHFIVNVVPVEQTHDDDWMLLRLASPEQSFAPNYSSICEEDRLPGPKDYVTAHFFTVGFLGSNKVSLISSQRRVVHYCGAPKAEESGKRKFEQICVTITKLQRSEVKVSSRISTTEDNSFVEVVGGNVNGSCGSGYFERHGGLVAIHLGDVDGAETLVVKDPSADDDSSFHSRSNAGKSSKSINSNSNAHSQGMVLCRMRSFQILRRLLVAETETKGTALPSSISITPTAASSDPSVVPTPAPNDPSTAAPNDPSVAPTAAL